MAALRVSHVLGITSLGNLLRGNNRTYLASFNGKQRLSPDMAAEPVLWDEKTETVISF
jgi:hypothetical protein